MSVRAHLNGEGPVLAFQIETGDRLLDGPVVPGDYGTVTTRSYELD